MTKEEDNRGLPDTTLCTNGIPGVPSNYSVQSAECFACMLHSVEPGKREEKKERFMDRCCLIQERSLLDLGMSIRLCRSGSRVG